MTMIRSECSMRETPSPHASQPISHTDNHIHESTVEVAESPSYPKVTHWSPAVTSPPRDEHTQLEWAIGSEWSECALCVNAQHWPIDLDFTYMVCDLNLKSENFLCQLSNIPAKHTYKHTHQLSTHKPLACGGRGPLSPIAPC